MNNITDIIGARLQWEIGGLIFDLIQYSPFILIMLCAYGFIWYVNRNNSKGD